MIPTLAQRIREAIGEKTPAEIARATGITEGAISQWLDGKTKSLKASTAALLEAETGFNAVWIATGQGRKMPDESWPFSMFTLSEFTALPKEEREAIEDFAYARIGRARQRKAA